MAVLESLYKLFEVLVEKGEVNYHWEPLGVSYGIDLADDGRIKSLLPLVEDETKKTEEKIQMPLRCTRSSNVNANFLCDSCGYLLGLSINGSPKNPKDCFKAAAKLHEEVLSKYSAPAAQAILNFFAKWDVENAKSTLTELIGKANLEKIKAKDNLIFAYKGQILNQDPTMVRSWEKYCGKNMPKDAEQGQCLVTGEWGPIARLHPNFKVVDSQRFRASLVSFNAPSYESYGHEQGGNAPVGVEASLAYSAALKYLLVHREHKIQLGDIIVIYWAESAEVEYSNLTSLLISPDSKDVPTRNDLQPIMSAIERGDAIDFNESALKLNEPFYILGLAPNASRLSVRFFMRDSFGIFLENLLKHHERALIDRKEGDIYTYMPLGRIVRETQNQNTKNPSPRTNLSAELLNAILMNQQYPRTLLTAIQTRIKAERGAVNANRAAILKAYFLRNLSPMHPAQEVLKMTLNQDSNYMPYVLGRLFALLERIQDYSVHPSRLSATIKDRYFTSACSTPASVFPYLLKLSQNHQKKLKGKEKEAVRVDFEKQLQEIFSKFDQPFPAHLSLEDQGVLQIGYYHQKQDIWNRINARKAQQEEAE